MRLKDIVRNVSINYARNYKPYSTLITCMKSKHTAMKSKRLRTPVTVGLLGGAFFALMNWLFLANRDNLQRLGGMHRDFTSRGFDFVAPDYRGYGKSSGRITSEAQLHADVAALRAGRCIADRPHHP